MKNIDNIIRRAFKELRKEYKSNSEMAKDLWISDSLVSRILKGKAQALSETNWLRLEPFLRPHIHATCHLGYEKCPLEENALHDLMEEILDIDKIDWYEQILEVVKIEKEKYLKTNGGRQ